MGTYTRGGTPTPAAGGVRDPNQATDKALGALLARTQVEGISDRLHLQDLRHGLTGHGEEEVTPWSLIKSDEEGPAHKGRRQHLEAQ